LFYDQPQQFLEGFSYQQIVQWELLHKSKDFSTNDLKKVVEVSIQKVISSSWMQIQKGKLCGKTLIFFQVRDKPNLNNIFKSYLGYHDLQGLLNSPDYFERLRIFLCND